MVVGDATVDIFSAQNQNWRIGGSMISFVQSDFLSDIALKLC